MPSLDEELARTFRAMAEETDPDAGARVAARVVAETARGGRPARRTRFALLAAAALAAAAAAAGAVLAGPEDGTGVLRLPGTEDGAGVRPPGTVDCVSALEFAGDTFLPLLGPDVGTVPPGGRLGAATYGPCPGEGGDDGDPVERDVYEMPGVPREQAILVVDGRGRGHVQLNTDQPPAGWDPDLQARLDQWHAGP